MKRLDSKVAIVTGAGEGIGRGIARRLASEGANVLVAELRADTGERTSSDIARDFGVQTTFRLTDVGRRDDILAMVDAAMGTFGRIDVLVNNAWGGGSFTRLEHKTAKEGIRSLTRTAAREWARHGILANIICPAAATAAYEAFRAASPENAAELLKQNPMGRMGDPERDIGGVAVFLASEDSRYVTGNTLFVDGGSHINGVSWAPELPE